MTRLRTLLFALLCASILFAPALAEARAGGSARPGGSLGYSSQGSMGSRSYNYNGAKPLERSTTPAYPNNTPYGAGPGFGQSHPFLTGLAGAFFGSWLGSLLFPHWGMGYGYGYGGGVFGSLFSWIIIIGLVWMVLRWFRRPHAPLTASPLRGTYFDPRQSGGGYGGYGGGYGAVPSASIAITEADYGAFGAILKTVQGAWSKGDLGTLRHYVTPEMLSYFSEALANNSSRGVENHVEQVELVKGDVREAWDEGRAQYATCLLQWRALDYTLRAGSKLGDAGALVEGDPQHPSDAQEVWTFIRSPGGHWLLSAIQQV